MKKLIVIPALLVLLLQGVACAYTLQQANSVLDSANNFFVYMKNRKYKKIWGLLSNTSKKVIINSILKRSKKLNQKTLTKNFKSGGPIAKAYWDAYLRYFNPDTVLNESQWGIVSIKEKTAVISIKYKKAPKPIYLKLFKENGKWKVGLAETFFKSYYLNISSP